MISYQWDWTSYVTVFTGQEQLRYWTKLYWRFFLKVFRWTWNWGFMCWSSTYIPPCSGSLPLPWQQVYCPLMEIQYASGADSGVSSLSFTMLLRVCLSSSVSPPLAGGNIVELGDILLGFDSCIMPVFQTLGILDYWDLAVFSDSCGLPDSYRCPWLLDSLILHSLLALHVSCSLLFLVIFRTPFSLPDSFGHLDSQSVYMFVEIISFFQRRVHY